MPETGDLSSLEIIAAYVTIVGTVVGIPGILYALFRVARDARGKLEVRIVAGRRGDGETQVTVKATNVGGRAIALDGIGIVRGDRVRKRRWHLTKSFAVSEGARYQGFAESLVLPPGASRSEKFLASDVEKAKRPGVEPKLWGFALVNTPKIHETNHSNRTLSDDCSWAYDGSSSGPKIFH